ncbi:phosphatidate cytidylyltransferase [Pseudonocardia bannensis]|uniref:Phosphatidate cytidylyltransferase n=1 Tax=Pseudonocardia bannensis TaxID=630973 RepID=A0A848DKB5_9PSEU|nr:phosphatidate cytidylyltransferase [Pseudonocardia bannensis]
MPVNADVPGTDAAGPAPARPSRSARLGRNLVAAIAVGVGLGAVILSALLVVRQAFIVVLAVATAVGTWELAGALRRGAGISVPLPVLLVGGQAMVWLSWPFGLPGLAVSFAATALACLLWRMREGAAHFLRDTSAALFTAAYVPLFIAFATLLVVPPDGVGRVLTFMLCVVASDVGGYAAGVMAGRHPMAPTISPKKSWEGFAGSQVAGMIAGALSVVLLLDGAWWLGALTGSLLVVTATLGDLVESMIKRDLGIKDMGSLLPGHGGLMDRLDSLLPAAFVSWLVLGLAVPVA